MAARCMLQKRIVFSPLIMAGFSTHSWHSSLIVLPYCAPTRRRRHLLPEQRWNYSTVKKFGNTLLRPVGWLKGYYARRAKLKRSAELLYHQYVDSMDYRSFFKVLSMPDSFQSWFIVAHLHVWLCTVRLREEGEDGKFVMHEMVRIFWDDVEQKMTAMGVTSKQNKYLKTLDRQFRKLCHEYDIGIRSDRKTFSAAIFNYMVENKEACDSCSVDMVVNYVQRQHQKMVSTDSKTLLCNGVVNLEKPSLTPCIVCCLCRHG